MGPLARVSFLEGLHRRGRAPIITIPTIAEDSTGRVK